MTPRNPYFLLTGTTLASWVALALVGVAAFVTPYVVGAARKRFSHPAWPIRHYAPHLVFLCTVRFAPMLSSGLLTASGIATAFVEAVVIWALGVTISERYLQRRLHRGARGA